MNHEVAHQDNEPPSGRRRHSLPGPRRVRIALIALAGALSVFVGLGWLGSAPLRVPFSHRPARDVSVAAAPTGPGSQPVDYKRGGGRGGKSPTRNLAPGNAADEP